MQGLANPALQEVSASEADRDATMAGGNVVVVENKAAWDKHHDQSKEQKKTVSCTWPLHQQR